MHWIVVLVTVLGPIVSLAYTVFGPGRWYANAVSVVAVWAVLWLAIIAIVAVNHRSIT